MRAKHLKEALPIVEALKAQLRDGDQVAVETLARRLRTSKATVQRAFTLLQREPGWGFQPENRQPFWSDRGTRHRAKDRGPSLPEEWTPTYFWVRRP